jgi:hypothetical protein
LTVPFCYWNCFLPIAQLKAQEPGPPGFIQVLQGLGMACALDSVSAVVENTDSNFSSFGE